MSPYIQAKLCEAISALLEDEEEDSGACSSNFTQCLFLLDLYKQDIPSDILNELHAIMNDYVVVGEEGHTALRLSELSDEEKAKLVGRLLAIYLDVRGGNLAF